MLANRYSREDRSRATAAIVQIVAAASSRRWAQRLEALEAAATNQNIRTEQKMISQSPLVPSTTSDTGTGVLLSGGLDSSILTAHLLDQGFVVQPFYIRGDLVWEPWERSAANRFLDAINAPRLKELIVLEMPLIDLYEDHWSVTGEGTPGAHSPDEAVYLPGRNALLVVKWALNSGGGPELEIICPFAGMNKRAVMQLGLNCPLELSFSCISPTDGHHCGTCNKCAERQAAFECAGLRDPTSYANLVQGPASIGNC
jgi:7-cyano-7-deazaguanine synthase